MNKIAKDNKMYYIIGAILLLIGGAYYMGWFGGEKDAGMITINCFDANKQPISCDDNGQYAIISGNPSVRYISSTISVTNTGNVDLNSYIKTATCKVSSVSNAACETSFASIVGTPTTNNKLIAKTLTQTWTSSLLDLEPLAQGDYVISVEACGIDTGALYSEVCKSGTKTLNLVTGIDFDVSIA